MYLIRFDTQMGPLWVTGYLVGHGHGQGWHFDYSSWRLKAMHFLNREVANEVVVRLMEGKSGPNPYTVEEAS